MNKRQTQIDVGRLRGFTLIELLVVIAILSLLLAILMPSLNRAKELSRQVVCASNERQIGLAIRLYATDNNHYLPGPVYIGQIKPSKCKELSLPQRYLAWKFLLPFLGESDAVWECPSNARATSQCYIVHPSPRLFGYPHNPRVMPMKYIEAVTTEDSPADVWLLEDIDGWYFYEKTSPDWNPPHRMGRNVLYLDGHVEWVKTAGRGISELP
ncbi:MAG: type II secretion system GspH family protein [Phycisphaerae bacterium]|nr:type II secretion system GspH family protein [Phycisphaerae bacterium]